MAETILRLENIVTIFDTDHGPLRAVDGVSFEIETGSTVCVVGESGCGKSATALSVLRLVPPNIGRIAQGSIFFRERNLLDLSEAEMRAVRGNHISMIFQEPMTSLNPVFTVGDQIGEMYRTHLGMTTSEALAKASEVMNLVGIPDPHVRIREYPHQMSGGMRQRVIIAMAVACEPDLMIADEPTTALDATIQAQILALMNDLKAKKRTSMLFITHNLAVVREMADRVIVMYAGRVFETADADDFFAGPLHPYTEGLFRSVPVLGRNKPLEPIPGIVPDYFHLPRGCTFSDRCPYAFEPCSTEEPPLFAEDHGTHQVRCYRYDPRWR